MFRTPSGACGRLLAAQSPARSAINPTGDEIPDYFRPFTPLIDAKAAGELLGVPHTWLLAQARCRSDTPPPARALRPLQRG